MALTESSAIALFPVLHAMNQVGGLFELVFLKKRDCTEIYPDGMFYSMFSPKFHNFINKAKKGVLVSGNGTRFILANTIQSNYTQRYTRNERSYP